MRIERDEYKSPRRDNACLRTTLGCGLLLTISCAVMTVGFLALLPRLTELLLRNVGFDVVGETRQFIASAPTPLPLPVINQAQPLSAAQPLSLGSVSAQSYNLGDTGIQISSGVAPSADSRVVQIVADEDDLRRAVQQFIVPQLSADVNFEWIDLNNARFDIYPGGLIAYGDFAVPQVSLRQTLGLVIQFSTEDQVRIVGLDVNGSLLTVGNVQITDEQGNVIGLVSEIEQAINQGLRELSVSIDGREYGLWRIVAAQDTLTVLLR